MIELPIPAEITKYEAKLVGPFTTRQGVCGLCAVVLAVGIWNTFKGSVPSNTLYAAIVLIAIPFGLIGWWKPYGMHAEQFLLAILFNTILSSTKRMFVSADYVTEDKSNEIPKDASKKEIKKMNKRKKKDAKRYKKNMIA